MIYTVVDIETTGLSRSYDDILSFGYIRIDDEFNVYDSNELYFYKDNFKVEGPAQSVHHLYRADLEKHKDEFDDNLSTMFSLCYYGNIISKNGTKFDLPFMQQFCSKHCFELDSLVFNSTLDIQKEFAPTYKARTGSSKNGKLSDYLDCLGITSEDVMTKFLSLPRHETLSSQLHGALFDATATLLVLEKYYKQNNKKL